MYKISNFSDNDDVKIIDKSGPFEVIEYVKKPEDTLIAETKNYIHYSNRYLDGYVAEQTFQVGDKIIHNVFGQGRIKSILSDRNAYMIKFEQIETPRIISFRVPIKRA